MTGSHTDDVLIIGSGIGGSIAALELADRGLGVTIITRSVNGQNESNTWLAQGGIAYRGGPDDTPESFVADIMDAGDRHCYRKAVDVLVNDGPDLIDRLLIEKYGVLFDKDERGRYTLNSEGHHSYPRILHASDRTGRSIETALHGALQNHPNITVKKGFIAVDLLAPHHHSLNRLDIYEPRSCVGAYVLEQETGRIYRFLSTVTILATGGLGSVFLRTTNPDSALGDGIAMANRMGARVINLEFVQFHPTTFFSGHAPRFLISEALRGAGAKLVDPSGNPFMQKYDPEWQDLASRDLVARSIHKEMLANKLENVYLDIASYLSADKIRDSFPYIYSKSLDHGIDITQDLIPVVPAAHYSCGGVWVDLNGQSTINNLFAVGEVSCTGVHGANRLASTSLLEALVWGHRAAVNIHSRFSEFQRFDTTAIPEWSDSGSENPDPALLKQDLSNIRQIMWNYVGLVRTRWRLDRAFRELKSLEHETERFYRISKVTASLIGLRNAVRTALLITEAAWENKRSMGCHFRE